MKGSFDGVDQQAGLAIYFLPCSDARLFALAI
jgi:hypothetical protein